MFAGIVATGFKTSCPQSLTIIFRQELKKHYGKFEYDPGVTKKKQQKKIMTTFLRTSARIARPSRLIKPALSSWTQFSSKLSHQKSDIPTNVRQTWMLNGSERTVVFECANHNNDAVAEIEVDPDTGEIKKMCVAPIARRQGIGFQMLCLAARSCHPDVTSMSWYVTHMDSMPATRKWMAAGLTAAEDCQERSFGMECSQVDCFWLDVDIDRLLQHQPRRVPALFQKKSTCPR